MWVTNSTNRSDIGTSWPSALPHHLRKREEKKIARMNTDEGWWGFDYIFFSLSFGPSCIKIGAFVRKEGASPAHFATEMVSGRHGRGEAGIFSRSFETERVRHVMSTISVPCTTRRPQGRFWDTLT